MTHDTIESIGGSMVQHGPSNDRAYLMKLDPADVPQIIDRLDELAADRGYSKIFAKVPRSLLPAFENAGYAVEAVVPGFFAGTEDGAFLGKYLRKERSTDPARSTIAANVQIAHRKASTGNLLRMGPGLEMGLAKDNDLEAIAGVFRSVFASYPFPIHDPEYLRATMASHVRYFCVKRHGQVVAVSSAEMDRVHGCVEMTDFATLPRHRGMGLAAQLLSYMERDEAVAELRTAYTIARALSVGMNVTFARLGYAFAGTLTRNTNISGHIESMNVWYKSLAAAPGKDCRSALAKGA